MKNNKKDSKYPKWFSPYSSPLVGFKPEQYIQKGRLIESIDIDNYDNLPKLDPSFEYSIEVYGDREDGYVIELKKKAVEPTLNPEYEAEMKKYNESLEKYNEWKKWAKIWKEDQREIAKEKEKELYEKLKEKYGK